MPIRVPIKSNKTSLVLAVTFCQLRANKACFKHFRIPYKCTDALAIVSHALNQYPYNKIGLTVILNDAGVGSTARPKYKRRLNWLNDNGYISIVEFGQGLSVSITALGYQVLEYYEEQFYKILLAGTTKYKRKLKYGYLDQLDLPR